jgi:hypothetical protein
MYNQPTLGFMLFALPQNQYVLVDSLILD